MRGGCCRKLQVKPCGQGMCPLLPTWPSANPLTLPFHASKLQLKQSHATKACAPFWPAYPSAYPLVQIMVASKFDNRLKEFSERWEVDKYLSATGYLPPNVKPFFVALPKVGLQLVAFSLLLGCSVGLE